MRSKTKKVILDIIGYCLGTFFLLAIVFAPLSELFPESNLYCWTLIAIVIVAILFPIILECIRNYRKK